MTVPGSTAAGIRRGPAKPAAMQSNTHVTVPPLAMMNQTFNHAVRSHLFRRYSTSLNHEDPIRELFRRTAQSVAVVTVKMPAKNGQCHYHGATLSSFTSIAMEPYPLVSFALRVPSRLAAALRESFPGAPSYMVINLLAAEQASVAQKFSRPDLHPKPFHDLPYSLTQEGIPVLLGCLGSISCELVSRPLPLHDLKFLEGLGRGGGECASRMGGVISSELFIARVRRVEETQAAEQDGNGTQPLLYRRRGYTTCLPTQSK